MAIKKLIAALFAALFTVLLVAPATAVAEPQSKFVTMFPSLKGFTSPSNQDLADLAQGMLDPNADSENNPSMLSGFTYFGQFLDHDLTLDTTPSPTQPVNISTLPRNVRSLAFD